jgi:hypothetical protein
MFSLSWNGFRASEQQKPHGRYEKRCSDTLPAPKSLTQSGAWKNRRSIGLTLTYRSDDPNDWGDGELRYYMMSFDSDAVRFAKSAKATAART